MRLVGASWALTVNVRALRKKIRPSVNTDRNTSPLIGGNAPVEEQFRYGPLTAPHSRNNPREKSRCGVGAIMTLLDRLKTTYDLTILRIPSRSWLLGHFDFENRAQRV